MDFFGRPTFQRSSYFDPWGPQPRVYYPQEQFYNPWNRQPQRQVFIDPEDYYDPIFGEKKTNVNCNCRDCHIRSELQQRKKKQTPRQNAFKKHQRQPKQEEDIASKDRDTISSVKSKEDPDTLTSENQQHNEPANIQQQFQEIEIQSEAENTKDEERKRSEDSEGNESEKESESKDNLREKDENKPRSKEDDQIQRKLKTINDIQIEVERLYRRVSEISSESKKYDYLYCEEMLTKCLLKLDDILAEGEDVIRTARRKLVIEINQALTSLEQKREVNTSD